jgi:hypothetical protein
LVTPTSFGDIVWTRFESEQGIAPWTELAGLIVGRSADGGYFVSEDALSWEPAADLPVEGEIVNGPDVVLAAISPGGPSQQMGPTSFRQVLSREWEAGQGDPHISQLVGSQWVAQALPTIDIDAPPGLAVRGTWLGNGAALGPDSWVVPALTFMEIPWGQDYGDGSGKPWPMWNDSEQVLEIFRSGTPFVNPIASLRVELTDGTTPAIRFIDTSDGMVVREVQASLPGWTADDLLTALRGWGLDDISLVVRLGDETRLVRPPWPMGEEWSGDIVTAMGRYYTVSVPVRPDYSATAVHLWVSNDGVTWRSVEVPRVWDGTLERADLTGGPQGLLMTVQEMGDGPVSVWTSPDGESWSRANIEPSYVWYASSTPFGWLIQPDFASMALSADGVTWESVQPPQLSDEQAVAFLNGRFIASSFIEEEGASVFWVGQLDTD